MTAGPPHESPDPAPRATAIILARGGSKGLPRKNILPVGGKPCALWTIEAALAAKSVARVALSTDDRELIEQVRATHGEHVTIVERPAELASDTATIDTAARHAAEHLGGDAADTLVILYANVPVRPAGLIDRAIAQLSQTNADSVQSYAPVGKFHPWWMVRISDSEHAPRVRPWEGDVLNHGVFRRQDLPPAYVPDGGVIALRREALMLQIPGVTPGPHAFFGREDRRGAVINTEGEVIDIDSRIDLLVADAILREQLASRSMRSASTTATFAQATFAPPAGARRC